MSGRSGMFFRMKDTKDSNDRSSTRKTKIKAADASTTSARHFPSVRDAMRRLAGSGRRA